MFFISIYEFIIKYYCYFRELTGFVEKLIARSIAVNDASVLRVILNNGKGRKVQLTAWQQNISIIENVAEMNKVSGKKTKI